MVATGLVVAAAALGSIMLVLVVVYMYVALRTRQHIARTGPTDKTNSNFDRRGSWILHSPGKTPVKPQTAQQRWGYEVPEPAPGNKIHEPAPRPAMQAKSSSSLTKLAAPLGLAPQISHNPLFEDDFDDGMIGMCYPGSDQAPVLVAHADWTHSDPNYRPVAYTAPSVLANPPWADPGLVAVLKPGAIAYNEMDTTRTPPVNRVSHTGTYSVVDGLPRNPSGRTGISGRGLLGRWGPNHAADAIVSRWQTTFDGQPVLRGGQRVLEIVLVVRRDNAQRTLPGGFLNGNEAPLTAARREFAEEVLNSLSLPPTEQEALHTRLETLLGPGEVVFKGVVDDPRNTDNAWIETTAVSFHEPTLGAYDGLTLTPGDDAVEACWTEAEAAMQMIYASHSLFVSEALRLRSRATDASFGLKKLGPPSSKPIHAPSVREKLKSIDDYEQQEQERQEQERQAKLQEAEAQEAEKQAQVKAAEEKQAAAKRQIAAEEEVRRAQAQQEQKQAAETAATAAAVAAATAAAVAAAAAAAQQQEGGKMVRHERGQSSAVSTQNVGAPERRHADPLLTITRTEAIYLGNAIAPAGGDQQMAVAACVRGIQAANVAGGTVPLKVMVVVHGEGIDVEAMAAPGSNQFGKVMFHFPVGQITYSNMVGKTVVLVAMPPADQRSPLIVPFGHAFETKKPKALLDAFAKCFKMAGEIASDPFRIRFPMTVTPNTLSEQHAALQMPRAGLEAKLVIGQGQYGKVHLALNIDKSGEIPAKHQQLAAKLMKPDLPPAAGEDFLAEALVMKEFDHPNVLALVGLCVEQAPWIILIEFMQYKDLGVVLRQCRKHHVYIRPHEMLTLAAQVADGMVYLSGRRYLHRDLAARNILLSHTNLVKIGDFGLCRRLPDGQDWWKLDKAGKLPVKYMSIESLTTKRFSIASDVWAFGVYLWELLSYAEDPWVAMNIQTKDVKNALLNGVRLRIPPMFYQEEVWDAEAGRLDRIATEAFWQELYGICQKTWATDPASRPSFPVLQQNLSTMLAREKGRLEPMRDVGLTCYKALQGKRNKGGSGGGGSLIRAAPSMKKNKKPI